MSSVTTPRRLTKPRVLVVIAAALLATGCSSVDLHPGQAAIVNNDTKISASEVDDTVSAACSYIEISAKNNAQETQALAISDLRSSLTTTMVLVPLYEQLVDELGLTIRPADIAKLTGQNPLPDGLTQDEQDILNAYFEDIAILQLSQALIGSNATDPTITNSSQLTTDESAAGSDTVSKFLAKQDVEVNPQYGTWDGANVTNTSGSLSLPISAGSQPLKADPQTGAKDVSDLPPSQVCG